jgi:ribonuclease D
LKAIEAALALSEDDCPPTRTKTEALPPIKMWRERFPEKFIPLSHARHEMSLKAAELELPVENLLTPELLRQVCWRLPAPEEIPGLLRELGARPWQIDRATPILAYALQQSEALELPEEESPETSDAPAE